MLAPPPRLAAIGFARASENPLLRQFEELYIFAVLSQVSRFSEMQYKDLATVPGKVILDSTLSYDDTLNTLQQICRSARTQYLFTGTLSVPAGAGTDTPEIKVTFRLYEAKGNRYIVDEVLRTPIGQNQHLDIQHLNTLVNQTVSRFLQAVFGDGLQMQAAPVTASLQALELALKGHQAPQIQEKIRFYETAVQADPRMEMAYYELARAYKLEHAYDKSVLNYRKTLEYSASSRRNKAVYATEAGILCALMGKSDFARQWWQKAIDYDPTYINPYFNIANICEDEDRYDEAETYFRKAQELDSSDFRTFFNLARIYSKMGVWDKALTQYHYQLQAEDGDAWCHSDVATCYLNLGDIDNARVHLRKTVDLDPEGEAGQYAQLILSGLG